MERKTSFNDINSDQQKRAAYYNSTPSVHKPEIVPITGKPVTGIPLNFSNYLSRLNLNDDLKLLVLSSSAHYYYEPDEMKDVQVLLNLKQLNHISQLNDFLKSVYCILPLKSLLIGCFADSEKQNWFFSDSRNTNVKHDGQFDPVEHGIESSIPFLNRIYSFIDIKTNRYLTKKLVAFHLEDTELRVLDMTDIDGITYFCAQKNVRIVRKYS
jgi:hypothetical protein